MENLAYIEELFGTPLDEVIKETNKNTIEGWKLLLGISLIVTAGVVTYQIVKSHQNQGKKE